MVLESLFMSPALTGNLGYTTTPATVRIHSLNPTLNFSSVSNTIWKGTLPSEVEIPIVTAQQWSFGTKEQSGTEGKKAQLAGSRNAKDGTTPCKGAKFPLPKR